MSALKLIRNNRLAALCMVALSLACASSIVSADDVASDNWTATLGQAEQAESTPADSGVVGMSSDELQAYGSADVGDEGDTEVPDDFVRNRRRFVVREMRFNSDWDTDPTSLPAMIEQYKRRTGLDAQALQPRKPLTFDDPELVDWPFIFMTAHNAFTLSDSEVAGLRRYLNNGGFLHSDDCLYGMPFGPAFHREMRKAYPDKELTQFNLSNSNMGMVLKQKHAWDQTNEAGLPGVLGSNAFEYLELDGRMMALYTPPDLGCMWEISSPPTPTNPLGTGMHNMDRVPGRREAAYRMGINIIFYAMTH